MIDAYSSLIEYREDEWEEYLDRLLLIDIFKPVIDAFPDKSTLKCVIRYITYAYSVDSDKIQIGQNWLDNKKQIFEFVQMKPIKDLYESLVHLKSDAVLKSAHKWLEFQENDTFKSLMSLKDLKEEMQLSCNSDIKKSSGETDYSQKFLNAGYVKELSKMIKDLEAELIQNNPKMKEAVKEVTKATKEKNSRSVGSYAL